MKRYNAYPHGFRTRVARENTLTLMNLTKAKRLPLWTMRAAFHRLRFRSSAAKIVKSQRIWLRVAKELFGGVRKLRRPEGHDPRQMEMFR